MATTATHRRPQTARPVAKMPYLPGLDGIRAIAVGVVILYHANHEWMPGGFLGVEVFFVISGYLITLLLVSEHQRSGHIALGQFWLRRARRLLPALAVLLFGIALWASLFKRDELGALRGDLLGGMFYVSNWYQIWVGQSYFSSLAWVPLRHLWSLAVEEQFYLFWPLIMTAVLRRRRPERLPVVGLWFFGGSLVTTVLMAVLFQPGPTGTPESHPEQYLTVLGRHLARIDLAYLSTFTRMSGVLLGAGLAMLWRPWIIARAPVGRSGAAFDLVGVLGLVAIGYMTWTFQAVTVGEEGISGYTLLYRGGFLMLGLATMAVIMAVSHPKSILGPIVLGNAVLRWIGERSYGLYLFHWPIFQIYRGTASEPLTVTQFAVLMVVTLAVTELSYHFVEMPVRRGRLGPWIRSLTRPARHPERQGRREAFGAAVVVTMALAFTGVSVATAEVKVSDIQESVEAGAGSTVDLSDLLGSSVPATSPASSAAPDPSVTTVAGDTTVPTTAAPTTTLPIQPIDVFALGDSVMLGAAPALEQRGYVVNAEQDRQFKTGVDILAQLKQAGLLGNVVVVHLGTNGPTSQETVDAMMAQLSEVPLVVFLTLRVPNRGWQDPNNALIRALEDRPNVNVLDWQVLSEGHPEWFYSDGTHLRPEGQQAYAQLITQAIGRG